MFLLSSCLSIAPGGSTNSVTSESKGVNVLRDSQSGLDDDRLVFTLVSPDRTCSSSVIVHPGTLLLWPPLGSFYQTESQ